MKKTLLGVLIAGAVVFPNQAKAQDSSCNNFWINPNTGQEECFNVRNLRQTSQQTSTSPVSKTRRQVNIPLADSKIKSYCRRQRRNKYSIYDTNSECLASETRAKYAYENDTDIANYPFSASIRMACFKVNDRATSWAYRYSCAKNKVRERNRKRNYMDN